MSDSPEHNSNKKPLSYGEGADAPDGVKLTLEAEQTAKSEGTSENTVPVIVYLVVIFGILALWAGNKIIHDSQGFDPLITNPYQAKITGPVEPPSLTQIGSKVYAKNCATCHQAGGAGIAGQFPTLHETHWVTGNKDRVINILLSGLAGPIEVAGNTYNGNMPPWGGLLDDKEIAGVISYIRSNEAWGNTASEVTEEDVAAVRAEYGVRAEPWSAPALLEQFPDTDEPEATPEVETPPSEEEPEASA